jgi:hypothetical protein
MQQCHKRPRPETAAMSRKQEELEQDFRKTVELEIIKEIVGT